MTRRITCLAIAALTTSCSAHAPTPAAPTSAAGAARGAASATARRPSIARRRKKQKAWTCARVKQARAAAFAEANKRLSAARIRSSYSIDAKAIARARAQGLDAARLERLLLGAFAKRLHREVCPKPRKKLTVVQQISANSQFADDKQTTIVSKLLALLGRVGGKRSLPLLWRLEALGYFDAGRAREQILIGLMKRAMASARCVPPSAAEVASARAQLAGFVVVSGARGRRGAALRLRKPTARELDDLAYLMAASSGRGPAVGTWPERGKGTWLHRAKKPSKTRRHWAGKLERAKTLGDFQQVAFAARRYLETLGYPKGIRTGEVHDYSWGGAHYSYVMRDLALAAETAGDVDEAAFAYRRANPGGGGCGTSVSARWAGQVKGVIRSEERRGHCRAVVLERLLAIDGSGDKVYGPSRLRKAGFDVVRLYRGALVARNRDIGEAKLRALLRGAPAALVKPALARLKAHGAESFEKRTYALEGIADTLRGGALPTLVALARGGSPTIKARALRAIAKLAVRPRYDPCDPTLHGFGMSGSSQWSRSIRPLNRSCKTHVKDAAREKLARRLHRLLFDRNSEVRRAAIEALGKLAARSSLRPLRRVAKRDRKTSTSHCSQADIDKKICKRRHPLREQARKALAKVEKLLAQIAADKKKQRARKKRAASR